MLMGMIIHIDKVTQGNLLVALSSGEDSAQELMSRIGRRQGQAFPRTGDDLVKTIFKYYSAFSCHALPIESIAAEVA
jgi:hypothetical protein